MASTYLSKTFAQAGNRRTFTISYWIKMNGSTSSNPGILDAGADGSNSDDLYLHTGRLNFSGYYGSTQYQVRTNAKYVDTSGWYHHVIRFDTTQSTANDRVKIYINGSQITDFETTNNPVQNEDMGINSAEPQTIGKRSNANDRYFSGYMANLQLVDGTALTPTSFGEYDEDSGIWKPKQYTGSYGTNGYWLKFNDASSLGADSSGNGNNFTLNNIAAIEQANDSPTNNFCVFNALANTTPSTVLSEGGCLWDNPAGQNWQTAVGTFALTSGKWYWETRGATYAFIGIADIEDNYVPINTNGYYLGYGDNNSGTTKSIGMYSINGQVYNAPSGSPDGTSYTSANMIGIALDMDNRKMWYSKDGTWISSVGDPTGTPSGGVALTHLGDTVYPAASVSASNGVIVAFGGLVTSHISSHNMTNTDANGYGAFKSSPPSGYYAICSKNLAEYGG